jgi:C1A family cysteine protease
MLKFSKFSSTKNLAFLCIVLIAFFITTINISVGCNCTESSKETDLNMKNPAAVYCTELGYTYKIVQTEQGEKGICVLPDDMECEAWDFYEGKCGINYSYCRQKGYNVAFTEEGCPFTQTCVVCILPDESKKMASKLMHLSEKAAIGVSATVAENGKNKQFSGTMPQRESEFKEKKKIQSLPSYFDWRDKDGENWMTPVKDQGRCGSCWAFSAVGAVEPLYKININNSGYNPDLSEQYLVSDCCEWCGDCDGGWHSTALRYVRDYGITDEGCFPYQASNSPCSDRCSDWESRLRYVDGYGSVSSDKATIKSYLIAKGPLSVALRMSGYWDGDIYRCSPDSPVTHAVVIAGYNDSIGYWIVKNSWGTGWNEDGYFKVGYGECSIEKLVYYADVKQPAHEISVEDLEAPEDILPEVSTKINATIRNLGLNDETNLDIQLLENSAVVNTTTIPELDRGSSKKVSFLWSNVLGMYNLTIFVPPVEGENNTKNNALSDWINVHTIGIFDINAPREVSEGESFTLELNVTNLGDYVVNDANATVELPAGLSADESLTKNIGQLSQGEYKEVEWTISADDSGTYSIGTRVESANGGSDSENITVKVTGSCFIFTAAYGSSLAPQVQMLTHFRGDIASKSKVGKDFFSTFNSIYYSISPSIAEFISQNEGIQTGTRYFVTPLVFVSFLSIHLNHILSGVLPNEFAMFMSLFLVALLSGAFYLSPLFVVLRKIFDIERKIKALKLVAFYMFIGLVILTIILLYFNLSIGISIFLVYFLAVILSSLVISGSILHIVNKKALRREG